MEIKEKEIKTVKRQFILTEGEARLLKEFIGQQSEPGRIKACDSWNKEKDNEMITKIFDPLWEHFYRNE